MLPCVSVVRTTGKSWVYVYEVVRSNKTHDADKKWSDFGSRSASGSG